MLGGWQSFKGLASLWHILLPLTEGTPVWVQNLAVAPVQRRNQQNTEYTQNRNEHCPPHLVLHEDEVRKAWV